MKHSTLLKVAFNTIPLVCPVRTTTTDMPTNEPYGLNDIFVETTTSIREFFGMADKIQSLLMNICPEDYKDSVKYVTRVFQKRLRAPADETYKITEYKNLSKLLSLVLKRGFFRQGYEEKDLTKHTPDSLVWAKHVILQKKLVDSLYGKDLFGYLYHQMISDAKALGAGDDILGNLSTTLNWMLASLNNFSVTWLKYIGEDNDQMANNVKYLRADADTRKSMDSIEASGLSRILNNSELSDICKVIDSIWAFNLNPMISNLFAIIHELMYTKLFELGAEAMSDTFRKYTRLYSNMRVFYLFARLISNLDKVAQDKGHRIIDNVTMFGDILSTEEFKDQIGQLIGQTSEVKLCNEISMKLKSKFKSLLVESITMIKAMEVLSASLLGSVLKMEDPVIANAMANIDKLVKGEEIDSDFFVSVSSSSSSDIETLGSTTNDGSQLLTEMSNSGMGNNNHRELASSRIISWVTGTTRLLRDLFRL